MDDTLDRNDVMERIKDTYDERVMAKLEQLRQSAAAAGWTAGESYRMHDDDYRWSFACWPTAERDKSDAGTVDYTIEIGEAQDYGDDDQPYGMSFRLDVVEYGGVILGQFAPYNYSQEVWVDGRDAAAVEERWLLIEQVDVPSVADLRACVAVPSVADLRACVAVTEEHFHTRLDLVDHLRAFHPDVLAVRGRTAAYYARRTDRNLLDLWHEQADEQPRTDLDCGHCIRPEDRCSDESDRNCFRPQN